MKINKEVITQELINFINKIFLLPEIACVKIRDVIINTDKDMKNINRFGINADTCLCFCFIEEKILDLGAESVFGGDRTQTIDEKGYFLGVLKRVWVYSKEF